MSRLLISVLFLAGLGVMVTAFPLRSSSTGEAVVQGPRCKSPVYPHEPMDCAVLIQMADLLLKEYSDDMKAYEEAKAQEEMLDKVEQEQEQAKLDQIPENSNVCKVCKVISYVPYKKICTNPRRDYC